MKVASAGSAPDLLGGTWLQAPYLGSGAGGTALGSRPALTFLALSGLIQALPFAFSSSSLSQGPSK